MKKIYLSAFASILFSSVAAIAQTSNLVGTWILTKADKILLDGTRVSDFGENPQGIAIFTADGFYSVQIYRANRLKFVSGDKLKGSAEEYKEASLSASLHLGRYSVDTARQTITFHVEHSSFPNQDGTTQVRPYEMKGDELSWKVAARPDGAIPVTVLRRASE